MANTVQANIEVNAKMNVDDIDKKTKEIINDINSIHEAVNNNNSSGFDKLQSQLEDFRHSLETTYNQLANDDSLYLSADQVEYYSESLLSIIESFKGLGAPVETFKNEFETLNEIVDWSSEALDREIMKFNELSSVMNTVNAINEETVESNNKVAESISFFEQSEDELLNTLQRAKESGLVQVDPSIMAQYGERDWSVGENGGVINLLSKSFELTEEETKELERQEEIRQALIAKINEEYDAKVKSASTISSEEQSQRELVKAAQDYNNEWINTGDYIKSAEEQLAEQNAKLQEEADIFEDMHYPGEELDNEAPKVENYSKIIEVLASKLGLSNSEAAGFAKTLGASATEAAAAGVAIGVTVGILKMYIDMLHKAESDTVGLVSGMTDLGVSGVEFFVDAIHSLIDSLDEAIEKMQEFADAGAEIQTAYYNTFTILGEEAGEDVLGFTEKLETLYGLDGDNLVKDMQSVIAAAGSLGVSTDGMVKATENMTLMAEDLSLIAGSFEKASNDIGNAISKGFIGRASSLYVLMTKAEKDELKALGSEVERYNYLMSLSGRIKGRYLDYLNTEAGKVSLLRNQYEILMNNISKLALGLYAKIAPVLTRLLQLANFLLTSIMKLLKIDLKGGANVGGNNIADDIADSIGKIGDNAEASGKAVDELKRKVASFDDVIQISDDKTNDGLGSELTELSDVDVSGIWELDDAVNNLNDDWAKFKELWNKGDFYGAGQEIAKWLKEQMESIPWESIQAKARKAGAAIAEVLNGIIEDKDVWADFGHTIAQALNTAVDFLLNFADLFNFRAFGEGLGVAWKQFWDEFDEIEAAEAIYEWFMGVIDTLGGFFESGPLNKMASSLVTMINKFFSSLTDEDITKIADTLIAIINDIFRAATRLMDGIEEGEAGEKIQKLLSEVFKKVSENAGFWGETLGNLIKSIYTFFYEALTNADKSGLSDSIAEFLSKLDLKGIFETWFKLQMELIWIIIESAIKTIIADIMNKITGETEEKITKEQIFETISFILSGLFALVAEFIGEKIAENFDDIKENISKGLEKVKADIGHWFENTKKSLGNKIDELLYSALQLVKGWIDKIKKVITEPFQGLNPFSGMNFSLPNFNISMPWSGKHANGGITNGASIGMIGEAGREAIIPLEHTGVMKELASEIVGAINGGGNNTPVVIDMSKAVKPVYTRAEYLAMADVFAEALKARGVVVSMEY